MSGKKIECKEAMNYVCQSLGEDLNSEKCVTIKAHLEECVDCKNYFKSVEITIDCYRKYNVEIPEDAHNRLMKFLDLEE